MDRRRILLVVAVLVAALGAALVFVYAQGADSRAADQLATHQVLVVTQQIDAGESAASAAADGKIVLADVPSSAVLPDATADGNAFRDQVALTTLYPGEQLITDKFGNPGDVQAKPVIPLPSGDVLLTINLADVNHVGPFLQPGSHVALWFVPPAGSIQAGTGDSPATGGVGAISPAKVLVPDVLVVSVGSTTTTPGATDAQGNALATAPTTTIGLAVDPDQASLVGGASFANSTQTLFMTLVGTKSKLKTDPSFTDLVAGR